MINDLIQSFLAIITQIDCWDSDNPDCVAGMAEAKSTIMFLFLITTISITILFISFASFIKYQFIKAKISDIALRRIIFLLGYIINAYLLFSIYVQAIMLSDTRLDRDVSTEIIASECFKWLLLGNVAYLFLFFLTAFILNVLKRRKLMTIFRSNNKFLGLF